MKRQALDHTKMDMLMRKLKIRRCMAVGILESLWHLTAREAPRGDIGRLSNERIAIGIDWGGDPHRLISALIDAGWIDTDDQRRLLIHDWQDHCDEAVKKYLKRNGLPFACRDMSRHGDDMSRLPEDQYLKTGRPEDQTPEGQRDKSRSPLQFPTAPSWQLDESYLPFVAVWREVAAVTGKPLIDEDFVNAHFRWGRLDPDQKQVAIRHVQERLDKGIWAGNTDPQYIPLPAKYIETAEYKRPVVGPKPREQPQRLTPSQIALQKAREEEARNALGT